MKIEVSNGEIVDKFTILQLKYEHIKDPEKLKNIKKEMDYLEKIVLKLNINPDLQIYLKKINGELWVVEDALRLLEKRREFKNAFVYIARLVYTLNDKRAEVKKKINIETNSKFVEEKSYG